MRARVLARRLAAMTTMPLVMMMFAVTRADALPSQGIEPAMRYATEPSTGSLVMAALVVIAAVRRGKSQPA